MAARVFHGISSALLASIIGLMFSACGGGSSGSVSSRAGRPAPAGGVVVQVGDTPISKGLYDHWMKVGAATTEIPAPGSQPSPVVEYEPPDFDACVAHLRMSATRPRATTAQLRSRCEQTYLSIQARILNFLITGYWLREQAAKEGLSVAPAEVRQRFEEEKRASYPTAASFRRFQAASRQTVTDLMFGVESQLLSTKLLEKFGKGRPGQAQIDAFNESMRRQWTTKTDCRPGYIIKDCKQYRQSP